MRVEHAVILQHTVLFKDHHRAEEWPINHEHSYIQDLIKKGGGIVGEKGKCCLIYIHQVEYSPMAGLGVRRKAHQSLPINTSLIMQMAPGTKQVSYIDGSEEKPLTHLPKVVLTPKWQ